MKVLEIGAGAGDGTLLLAKAMPANGMLLAMEVSVQLAAAARKRFAEAGLSDRINVIVGEPARFLHKVRGPFDVIVVNGDQGVPRERVRTLLAPSGVLIEDHPQYSEKNMTIAEWLAQAKADAEKRGMPELIPLLDGLAQATGRLRAADWNDPSTPSSALIDADDSAQGKHANDDDQ